MNSKGKMKVGESSSAIPRQKKTVKKPSHEELLKEDYDFTNLNNDHLFRTPEAGNLFNDGMARRAIGKCYYYNFPPNIPHLFDKVETIERRWGFANLACLKEPSYRVITRLFYANATFNRAQEKITSYILGEEVEISVKNLCVLLGFKDDGEKIYDARKGRLEAAALKQMKEVVTNRYQSKESASHLAAPEKFVWEIGNKILTPITKSNENLENRNIMLLYRMWYDDQYPVHVPYLIMSHMEKVMSQRNASLPYGTLIARMLELQGISIPENDWDFQPEPPTNLASKSNLQRLGYRYSSSIQGWIVSSVKDAEAFRLPRNPIRWLEGDTQSEEEDNDYPTYADHSGEGPSRKRKKKTRAEGSNTPSERDDRSYEYVKEMFEDMDERIEEIGRQFRADLHASETRVIENVGQQFSNLYDHLRNRFGPYSNPQEHPETKPYPGKTEM